MKVLHVYKDYYPILGGIENHVRTVAEGQAAGGHDVTVLVTNPAALAPEEVMGGVRVHRARRLATIASTPLSIDLFRALGLQRPDITHLHFPYPVGEIAQLRRGRRPYVITYHSDVVRQRRLLAFYRPLLNRVLRRSGRILATSRPYIESSPFLSSFKGKCSVVPLSVDHRRYDGVAPLIAPGSVPTLLFVGRHRYYKGVDDLLHALRDLEARLLIGGDGPMRARWEQLAANLQIGDRVQFLGDVSDDDLPRLYASADVFVLPANSRAEAFGKVLLEAMASKLPCVTTELGTGTSYVVQHGVTGFVVPPQQPEALTAAIATLLKDKDLRQEMGTKGNDRVLQEFTVEKMLQSIEAIYQDVLAHE